ncbi:hypothetical protein R6Q57_012432 [Mikania cordata]
MIGVLDAITKEGEKVFVVGDDWGAIIAWHLCMFRPDRVKGLVNMSVPFIPWDPNGDIVTRLRSAFGEDHYMTRFQEPGDIESKLGKMSPQTVMKKFLAYHDPDQIYFPKGKGFGYAPGDTPVTLPPWLSQQDLDYLASYLQKNGITGGVNYYRAFHLSWELTAAWKGAKVMVPTKFIIGDLDLTYHMPGLKDYILGDEFKKDVPLLQEVVVMEDVAHFINQETPHEVNIHIIKFLQKF